jgi:hypothetical protein
MEAQNGKLKAQSKTYQAYSNLRHMWQTKYQTNMYVMADVWSSVLRVSWIQYARFPTCFITKPEKQFHRFRKITMPFTQQVFDCKHKPIAFLENKYTELIHSYINLTKIIRHESANVYDASYKMRRHIASCCAVCIVSANLTYISQKTVSCMFGDSHLKII